MTEKSNIKIPTFEKYEIIFLLILSLDLFLGLIPLIFYYLTFILLIYRSSKIEMSFILIFFTGEMIISVLYRMGYDIMLILLLTGIILITEDLLKWRYKIFFNIIPLLIVFFGFFIAYIYGPQGRYSNEKIIFLVLNGSIYFLFFTVFIKSDEFNNLRFGLFLIFLFLFLTKHGIQNDIIRGPANFYDFGFLRYGLTGEAAESFAGYHQFGSLALFSVAFILASIKKLNWVYIFLIVFCFYLSLLAGARQMIYGIVGLLLFYLISNMKFIKSWQIVIFIILPILSIIIIESKNIPFLSDFLLHKDVVETAGGRLEGYTEAIRIFKENPLFGNGIGGFSFHGLKRSYPHNIIFEIMAEGGIFMLIILFFAVLYAFRISRYNLTDRTENGTLYIMLVLCYAIRAFSSSDLIYNIALISALVAIGFMKNCKSVADVDSLVKNQTK